VVHLARAAAGDPIDAPGIDAALRRLDGLAGLEVWRACAELAAATGRADLWSAAGRRAATLVATSGPEAPRLQGWLDRELVRLGRP
jgi:hypothetical protein